jgi:hypothetical protein
MPYWCKMKKANSNAQYFIVPTIFLSPGWALYIILCSIDVVRFRVSSSALNKVISAICRQGILYRTFHVFLLRYRLKHVSEYYLSHRSPNFFFLKRPHPLLRTGSLAARGKVTIIGIPNCLNCCEIFIVYTIYKCGRGPHAVRGPCVGDIWPKRKRLAPWRIAVSHCSTIWLKRLGTTTKGLTQNSMSVGKDSYRYLRKMKKDR